ncbi:endonuclease [Rhodococcus opacus]|uniref:Endonuclease n=2 Tax=Rhodococcus opacus TaxID=37919 RepID=A0AAX3Y758_RHOOP|nr:endonuclease [Rhodococcus opacus]MCZ4584222.1 endonuclease [Rhodococcus opacus]MDV6241586.1 endonuclease [Rhodococcus opacus]QZS56406.1 endonuclease [Rhodococcus opacus]RKM76957.1 endonuclease [Rhodococcus opacus]UNN01654.1 endonuclease [Rhodococcus opacus]
MSGKQPTRGRQEASVAETARALLDNAGPTYASASHVTLKDTPTPLFQLLTLSLLLSTRISSEIAVAAARELFRAGLRSPRAVRTADRRTIISALGRAGYVRYDESTATRLHAAAVRVDDEYGGDLRRLARACEQEISGAVRLLTEFDGIGPVGADIFLREVQDVWPWVRPYFDTRASKSARELGLPDDPDALSALAPEGRVAELAAALVRVSLDTQLREDVRGNTC